MVLAVVPHVFPDFPFYSADALEEPGKTKTYRGKLRTVAGGCGVPAGDDEDAHDHRGSRTVRWLVIEDPYIWTFGVDSSSIHYICLHFDKLSRLHLKRVASEKMMRRCPNEKSPKASISVCVSAANNQDGIFAE